MLRRRTSTAAGRGAGESEADSAVVGADSAVVGADSPAKTPTVGREIETRRIERAWSPAQLVALVIGLYLAALGAIVLARLGIHGNDLRHHTIAGGFHQTPILAFAEIGFGVLMILTGVVPGGSRGFMSFLGVLALGFGIVVLIQAESFHSALGAHRSNGWLYVALGGVALVAAMASPVFHRTDRFTTTSSPRSTPPLASSHSGGTS
ncbi:MAG: hypothetical protein ACYDAD_07760 [Acidimicrobiales bacterium]